MALMATLPAVTMLCVCVLLLLPCYVINVLLFPTGDLEAFKKQAFVLKEGVEYKIKISFKVRCLSMYEITRESRRPVSFLSFTLLQFVVITQEFPLWDQ